MIRTTLFAAAALATLVSGQALADTTYYGTSSKVPASQEQNNAFTSAERTVGTVEDNGDRSGFGAEQVFGAPNEARAASQPVEANSGTYLGTAWRYQDNADTNARN